MNCGSLTNMSTLQQYCKLDNKLEIEPGKIWKKWQK